MATFAWGPGSKSRLLATSPRASCKVGNSVQVFPSEAVPGKTCPFTLTDKACPVASLLWSGGLKLHSGEKVTAQLRFPPAPGLVNSELRECPLAFSCP